MALDRLRSLTHSRPGDEGPATSGVPARDDAATLRKARSAPAPDDPAKADSPLELRKPSWFFLLRKAIHEFNRDQCTDLAAALTYYSVLALFPGLIALVALLGVFGQGESTVNAALNLLGDVVPQDSMTTLRSALEQMVQARAAGLALATGLVGALWSASGYVGAFGRALNRIYEVDEGRPIWKLRPLQFGVTLAILLMAALVMTGLVVSGPIAELVGDAVGMGGTALTAWNLAKWPVILGIVVLMVALLYYATPNVRQPRFRWLSIGAFVAIGVWVLASAGFGFYVANFGSYNKTYGALSSVIVLLLWLWLTNLALLFGAEMDTEIERARQLQAGIRAEESLQLPPRDTAGSVKKADKREEFIEEGRRIRLEAEDAGAQPPAPAEARRDQARSER